VSAAVSASARAGETPVHALYARYPRDLRYLPAWSRAVDRLIGG
jgi:hypothetical protein